MSDCPHLEEHNIVDEHEGTIVCTNCSRVIDRSWTNEYNYNVVDDLSHSVNSKSVNAVLNTISDLAASKHFSNAIVEEAEQLYSRKLKNLSIRQYGEHHLAVYALFLALLDEAFELWELSGYFQCNINTLHSIDKQVRKYIFPPPISGQVERNLAPLLFTFRDLIIVKKFCEKTQHLASNRTVIACCAICYMTNRKELEHVTEETIADTFHLKLRTIDLHLPNVVKCLRAHFKQDLKDV